MSDGHFEVHVHERERVVEVRYPKRLTPEALEVYRSSLQTAVQQVGPSWRCLVDQTRLDVIPPHLTDVITELNRWAAAHGLVAAVRVVKKTAVGELQSRRILRESGLGDSAQVFFDRDEAWQRLTG
ncbi:MAG: hypothetical protein MUC96_28750 [Myxococcaceae bacterium]|jgi:hypothetical protein|nr:hypothetical protein [Myxococcaceae bacterium]